MTIALPASPLPAPAATFLQGPPPEHSLTGTGDDGRGQFDRLQFQYAADRSRPEKRQLTAANDTVSYEARNHGEGVAPPSDVKYLLGVVSRKRGRMDVYDADGGGVIYGMRLKAVRGSGAESAAARGGGEHALDDRARRDILISAFGSRKKQAMDASQKANIINPNAVAAAAGVAKTITKSAASAATGGGASSSSSASKGGSIVPDVVTVDPALLGSTSSAKVETSLMEARRAKLPPFRLDAESPSEAYPLEGLMPSDVMDALAGPTAALIRAITSGGSSNSSSAAVDGEQQGEEEDGGVEGVIYRMSRGCDAARALLTSIASRAASVLSASGSSSSADASSSKKKSKKRKGSSAAEDDEEEDAEISASASSSSAAPPLRLSASQRRTLQSRISAALYLKHLVSMYNARDRLSYKAERPRKEEEGDQAAAAAAGAEDAVEDAAAGAASGRLIIPGLKFVPDGALTHMLATFTEERAGGGGGSEGVTYVRTPDLTDRLASHIACAALHAHGWPGSSLSGGGSTGSGGGYDLALLARDLKLAPVRLAAIFRELGCRTEPVRSADGAAATAAAAAGDEDDDEGGGKGAAKGGVVSYRVTLTVPLTFPKPKLGRKK